MSQADGAVSGKWHVEGYDTFENKGRDSFYRYPGEYETEEQAVQAALDQLAELEISQPSSSSGGQGLYGVQDHVYVVGQNRGRRKIFPPRDKQA